MFCVVSWDGGSSWNGICRVEQSSGHLDENGYTGFSPDGGIDITISIIFMMNGMVVV